MNGTWSSSSTDVGTSESVSPSLSHISSRTTTPCLSELDGTPHCRSPSSDMAQPLLLSMMAVETECRPETDAGVIQPRPWLPKSGPEEDEVKLEEVSSSTMPKDSPSEREPLGLFEMSEPPTPSLASVGRILRLRKFHKRRHLDVEASLHCLQVSSARISRLTQTARSARRALADCIRAEDKKGFATIFNTFHEICDSFDSDSTLPRDTTSRSRTRTSGVSSSFLDVLPLDSQTDILQFLSCVRVDPGFLVDRIASLSHKELLALLPTHNVATESVFGSSSLGQRRSWTPTSMSDLAQTVANRLRGVQDPDPLSTMVHSLQTVGDHDPAWAGHHTGLWADVCARLIIEQKPGSERFIPAVLDLWSHMRDWSGKQQLELWIMRTLQEGAFVLDRPSKQSFRMRVQGRESNGDDTARMDLFYHKAVLELLDCMSGSSGACAIPEGVLEMCKAILEKLGSSDKRRRAFPYFVLHRWFSASFLTNVVTLPEAYGSVTDNYISDMSRQRILKEVCMRAQKAIFDVTYSWKQTAPVAPEIAEGVEKLASAFRTIDIPELHKLNRPSRQAPVLDPVTNRQSVVVLCQTDLVVMVNALYPERIPSQQTSDWALSRNSVRSSASSISGMSLFNGSVYEGSSDRSSVFSMDNVPRWNNPEVWVQGEQSCETNRYTEPPNSDLNATNGDIRGQGLRDACQRLLDTTVSAVGVEPQSAEPWAILCLSGDGLTLTRAEAEEPLPTSDPGQSAESERPSEFRDLENAICRFIENYEGASAFDDGSSQCSLSDCLEDAAQYHNLRSDFVASHDTLTIVQQLDCLIDTNPERNISQTLLSSIVQRAERSINRSIRASDRCETWFPKLLPFRQEQLTQLGLIAGTFDNLRAKIWYMVDIRTSAMYEEARSVATALRIMGKPSKVSDVRHAPPLRHWNSSRAPGQSLQLKTEAQMQELMAAPPAQGGPNKLSSEQSQIVVEWMRRSNIENICKGEERLHRLCLEVRKCVEALVTVSPADSPVLWSSELFEKEKGESWSRQVRTGRPSNAAIPPSSQPLSNERINVGIQDSAAFKLSSGLGGLTLDTQARPASDSMSANSSALTPSSSRDYFNKSPTLTNKSSATFWSPVGTTAHSPSSATSICSRVDHSIELARQTQQPKTRPSEPSELLSRLRQAVTSLLLSDIGSLVFNEGSETDRAMWDGLGGEIALRTFEATSIQAMQNPPRTSTVSGHSSQTDSLNPATPTGASVPSADPKGLFKPDGDHLTSSSSRNRRKLPAFDYRHAYEQLLGLFAAHPSPYTKLKALSDLQRLLLSSNIQAGAQDGLVSHQSWTASDLNRPGFRKTSSDKADRAIVAFQSLFSDAKLRPRSILRDLQYIASVVPSPILDDSGSGTAFWNATIAILGLKHDICKVMVETADSIIAHHTNKRGHGHVSSSAQQQRDSATFLTPSRTSSAEDVSRYRLADAAQLLQITAKEGDPVAQRELATLYLTNPELMDRIIAPFVRPREVFKEELESQWKKQQDPNRCDPVTMCVAHHWMGLSSRGGDTLAKEYLRAREEMERLP